MSSSDAAATPADNYTSVEAFKEFQRLLLDHAANRPPDQLEIFQLSEAKLLTDYVSLSFFKHYLLFQYVLIFPREVETLRLERPVDAPMASMLPELQNARLLPEPKQPGSQSAGASPAPQGETAGGGEETAAEGGDLPEEQPGDAEAAAAEDEVEGEAAAVDTAGGAGEGGAADSVSPEIEAIIDQKIAEAERTLSAKLLEREAHFMQKLQGGA